MKIRNIELIVYDFDGVMTDNNALIDENGKEYVKINRSDGLAVSIIKKNKIPQIIISTESNEVVIQRSKKLKLLVFNNVKNKKIILLEYCEKNKINLKNVIYIGNDINDMKAMSVVGHAICPADASEEIKSIANIVLSKKGGEGVIRELLYYLDIEI